MSIMNKILITGSRGFIGSRLLGRITKPFCCVDLRDGQNLLSCDLPDYVNTIYHLAAQTSVEASWSDPVHDMDNLKMVVRIVKRYPHARIIYTASAATKDTSPYGFSKWASAEYLKAFHKNYIICTLPNVYGELGGKSVVDIFKGKDEVVIFGDGTQTRSYIHVDDIIEGLVLAKDWDKGEYFLGDGVATTVLQLAKGKNVKFGKARREAKEAVLPNTTPNWTPKIRVLDYICQK